VQPNAKIDRQHPVDIGRAPPLARDVALVELKQRGADPRFRGNTACRGYCANACCAAFLPVWATRMLALQMMVLFKPPHHEPRRR